VGAQHQNDELKREITQLRVKAMELEEKNSQYREHDALIKLNYPTSEELIFARVIFKILKRSDRFVIVNRGTKQYVRKNMPVIAPEGLVGRIEKVSENDSRVLFITDPESQIAVKIFPAKSERQQGEMEEDWETKGGQDAILAGNSMECFLKYLPKDFVLEEGMRVETSGMEEIFLKGLPVGEVIATNQEIDEVSQKGPIKSDPSGFETRNSKNQKEADKKERKSSGEKEFLVKPFVSFHRLNEVVIIKKVFEEPKTVPEK
jgi:rod shape-determining protein MreC